MERRRYEKEVRRPPPPSRPRASIGDRRPQKRRQRYDEERSYYDDGHDGQYYDYRDERQYDEDLVYYESNGSMEYSDRGDRDTSGGPNRNRSRKGGPRVRDNSSGIHEEQANAKEYQNTPSAHSGKLPTGPKALSEKRPINEVSSASSRGPFRRLAKSVVNKNVMGEVDEDDYHAGNEAQRSESPGIRFMQRSNINGPIYERIQQVGEGTYGKVYKAKNKITGALVALKRLRLETEREGFPITANREIGLLQSFDHRNIVGLSEMMVERNQVFMVFPYMSHDLSGILQQQEIKISDGEKKNIFRQLLEGINYLHKKRVIHRDIKGSNILISTDGVLKITDFGLARAMKNINPKVESPNYTNRVITLWYRPPEILLGSTDYGREIDIWGIGCLLLELFTRHAVFQGTNEVDQLLKVYEIMGTIKTSEWPDADRLPWFEMLRPNFHTESKFKEKFGGILSPECFDLAASLLRMNPAQRMTAEEALRHPYFQEEPAEASLEFLKHVRGEWHEFEAKRKRKEMRQQQLQQQQHQQKQQQRMSI